MIIVKEAANPIGNKSFEAMFEARKQVFVDLLKWELPVLDGRFEVDQFDDSHARYLIVADESGTHLGSTRLLPTTRPHILGSLFADLCSDRVPIGPDTVEITRFCLGRNQTAAQRRQTRNLLVTALVSDALDRGVRTYTGVAEMSWLQQILAFGWRCRPLGLPRRSCSGMIGALAIEIDCNTPVLLAANGIWTGDMPPGAQLQEAA